MSRLKVLVAAYACSPARGSEYGVGWGWIEAISQHHDLWVLVGSHCREEIEAELSLRPELRERMNFHYIPRVRWFCAEKLWPPAYLYTYRTQWQKAALTTAQRLHAAVHFDLVHQLTYVGFRVPGYLWQLDAPFVWGPIGGLEQTNWRLIPALGISGALRFAGRNLLNEADRRLSRLPRQAFRRAQGGIIAATTGVRREIRRFYGYDSFVLSEIGLPPLTSRSPVRRSFGEPLKLVWCGNLLPGKALPLLLRALERFPASVNWHLTVIGDGPCELAWQRMAQSKGLNTRCDWIGRTTRPNVLTLMQAEHVLVITSVHDLTSTVLIEALANALPVVCPDHCGFSDAITEDSGIKVRATSPEVLVSGLRDAIVRLTDEDLRFRLANGALARSADYCWKVKAQRINEVYAQRLRQPASARMEHNDTSTE